MARCLVNGGCGSEARRASQGMVGGVGRPQGTHAVEGSTSSATPLELRSSTRAENDSGHPPATPIAGIYPMRGELCMPVG